MKKRLLKINPKVIAYKAVVSLIYSLEKLKEKILPPYASIMTLIGDNFITQRCIYIATELGISDKLMKGPMHINQLSVKTNTNADALYRVMRALASKGIFKESGAGIFSATRLSRSLESINRDSILGWVKYFGSDWHNQQWADLRSSVSNGKDACGNLFGLTPFEWLNKNPGAQDSFNEAMDTISNLTNKAIIEAYDFPHNKSVLDIGGGKGRLLSGILKSNKSLRGLLFDRPDLFQKSNIKSGIQQMEFLQGDLFEAVPLGKDIYIMKSVLHDWDDEKATEILRNVSAAMHSQSRLLVIEIVIEEGNVRQFGKLLDVAMLVLSGGRERTVREYDLLFQSVEMKINRVIPTASPFSILEIIKNKPFCRKT